MFSFFKKKIQDTSEAEQKEVHVEDFTNIEIISDYFKNETGVTFEKQTSILKSKLTTFCRHRDIYSFTKLLETVKADKDIKQELIDYLTTNETFFYREFSQIQKLVELVKKSNKKVDILCAPSATGEEPYSIAIALLEAGVTPDNFKILGIDINALAILDAKTAVYKVRNIRNLSDSILDKYFVEDEKHYILKPIVKSQVTYKLANLFDPSFKSLGKFDFIFSRNMLIYFDRETKIKAKEILESMRKNEEQEIFFGHADLF
ncbi:CheR family methyltransferase [Sulfurimonas sp.]|uniref:CheR family methyltransferase n=1 Tax=Sulfurimonas sp. TaxID=2022749 RepID=UPI0026166340|nr:CheR family methyltransferase [Sulfurimonas sp.]MCW8895526.1 protein-glutamate O-methyltransferase CheR [Sulfurimonas sp.]MCW9067880.1 protein-glutamate O-methyltransferase CheR [Sulfurimonas sp.]